MRFGRVSPLLISRLSLSKNSLTFEKGYLEKSSKIKDAYLQT